MTADPIIRSALRLGVLSAMVVLALVRIAAMRRRARQQRVRPNVEVTVFKPQLNVNFASCAGTNEK